MAKIRMRRITVALAPDVLETAEMLTDLFAEDSVATMIPIMLKQFAEYALDEDEWSESYALLRADLKLRRREQTKQRVVRFLYNLRTADDPIATNELLKTVCANENIDYAALLEYVEGNLEKAERTVLGRDRQQTRLAEILDEIAHPALVQIAFPRDAIKLEWTRSLESQN